MIFSPLAWFWIVYFSAGFLITFEGVVIAWNAFPEYEWYIKLIGSVVIIVCWPIIAFMENNDD